MLIDSLLKLPVPFSYRFLLILDVLFVNSLEDLSRYSASATIQKKDGTYVGKVLDVDVLATQRLPNRESMRAGRNLRFRHSPVGV